MEGPRVGRRTIGQLAGNEINIEIEGVQDNKKIISLFAFFQGFREKM